MMASCGGKDNPDNKTDNKDTTTTVTEINGTKITSTNNLVGIIKDSKTGKGIAGVPVTDGTSVTQTDANGVYQFKGNIYARKVYYSKPSGYDINLNENKAPIFYSPNNVSVSGQTRTDFVLSPSASSDDTWTLFCLSDPQCKTDDNVNRFKTETIPDIKSYLSAGETAGTMPNPVAVTLGDITFDNVVQWPAMQKALSNIKLSDGSYLPIFNCIGNHDHYSAKTSDYECTENFVNYMGPTDYSFNMGEAHIVVMDDVLYTGKSGSSITYDGGFTNTQYKWLQEDLALVTDKANKLLILCCHIPFRGGASTGGASVNTSAHYADFLQLMTQFHEAHIMIGHTHYPQNYIHTGYVCKGGKPIYEHILGATCGAWWYSNMNVEGSPNMYGVFRIKGNTMVDEIMKSTALSDQLQMRVYDGGQIYRGSIGTYHDNMYKWGLSDSQSLTSSTSPYSGYFIAKIWNSDESNWTVTLEEGGKSYPMVRVAKAMMNASSASYYYNVLNRTTDTYMKSSVDYYVVAAPSGNPASESGWQVVAKQKLPDGTLIHTYTANNLQTDYAGY